MSIPVSRLVIVNCQIGRFSWLLPIVVSVINCGYASNHALKMSSISSFEKKELKFKKGLQFGENSFDSK